MRTWLGSIIFVLLGTLAVAPGCGGDPQVSNDGEGTNGGATSGGKGPGTGTGATSGSLVIGDGGTDGSGTCPSSCEDLNANCGFVTDEKCGGVVECGDGCPKGEFCGGDGPSRCGTGTNGEAGACSGDCQSCTPKTCEDLGFTCGPAGDSCGGKLDCGPSTCAVLGQTCGGAGKPGQCGCTGACADIPDCSEEPKKTTSLTGKVYDPAGNNPLYNVFVYVANNPDDPDLKSFPKGITCDVCGASAAGSPLLSEGDKFGTFTDVDGSFTLKNVPVGKGVTVVIQLGRWRRVFELDIDNACDENPVPDKTLKMPSKQSEGDIPLMAMVTGKADSLECVLRKMGIDGSEFTNPAGNGRVQFYLGSGADNSKAHYGQKIDGDTPMQSELLADDGTGQPLINQYDMTILACQGGAYAQSAADQATLRAYASAGGRVFTTHYSYTWLTNNDENTSQKGLADNWSEVATWKVDEDDRAESANGHIDLVSNPKGSAFQGWLEAVNASVPGSGIAKVNVIRHDADAISSVEGQTQQWLYRDGVNARHCGVTRDVCTSQASCGATKLCSESRVDCSANANACAARVCRNNPSQACTQNSQCSGNNNCIENKCNANTCTGTDYTGEDIPLHFTYNTPVNVVQDLTTDPPTLQCGRVLFSDFHVADADEHDKVFPAECGKACTLDTQCATGGKCVSGRCLDPMTAQEKVLEFMIFDLGSCVPPPTSCVPKTECPAGEDCGYAPDGCGGLISCGECAKGESCGVGNPPVPNKCGKGTQTCVPLTCAAQKKECGPATDGCGEKIDSCGECAAGQLCLMGACKSVN
ncbi:MAG: hypothetical protein EOO73_27135 [Myxococcales bacterium]|nr:MAG: hypothetical protein EOO73_27135 [Myxococcales bacterium]